jgi:CRP-like cAMP-binding protein
MAALGSDPWLLHGGIIALCDDRAAAERLEDLRQTNIIVTIGCRDIEEQLPRVLHIIDHNPRILYQRELGADLVRDISGYFKLRNDLLEARCFSNLICNFLYNANRLDGESRAFLRLSLYEMLLNAIEHGNCGITYAEKSECLDRGGSIEELIAQRCRNPRIACRQVTFEYAITPESSQFFIADEGCGFDWRALEDPTEDANLARPHGRGILMTRAVTQNMRFNEKGNEVRFEIAHQSDEASSMPALLEHIEPVEFAAGDAVFQQGEPGNFLYYIAKGRYDVIVNDRVISSLSPDDIFMGEMSFLLNNRRSATVRARTSGRLIAISKNEFIEAVKAKPHYALFLSRLLAQRLQRVNLQSASSTS